MDIQYVVAALLVLISGALCVYRKHRISPCLKDGELMFDIRYGETSGLLSMHISDQQNNDVWDVHLNHFHGESLIYGEVPKVFKTEHGTVKGALQLLPENGEPPHFDLKFFSSGLTQFFGTSP